jgi:predicted MFS family arabinose efflux permease
MVQAEPGVRRTTLSALCASLIGIGLARFAYTPLIPAIVDAGWFSASQAAYLGAANLAGYLAGALSASFLAVHAAPTTVLRAMMLLATASFLAGAWPASFLWFFGWRFAAGLAGGALMVLAATTVLAHVRPSRRGWVAGAIFTGVGLGVVASGTLVPVLMRAGLVETWLGLGALSVTLTAFGWGGWPRAAPAAKSPVPPHATPALRALYLGYGLNAVGLVPHMVFLVDFIARDLQRGLDAGGAYWVLFGLGAVAGPLAAGRIADRIGFAAALRLAFLAQVACIALPVLSTHAVALGVSSVLVGAFVPGVVPLALGRVHELVGGEGPRRAAWAACTAAFALGQAGAAYLLSFVYAATGSYPLLFGLGAAALALAFLTETLTAVRAHQRSRPAHGGPQ